MTPEVAEIYWKARKWLKIHKADEGSEEYSLVMSILYLTDVIDEKDEKIAELNHDGTGVRNEAGTDIRADGRAQD